MTKLLTAASWRSIGMRLAAMAAVGAVCMALVALTMLLLARTELQSERTERAHAVVDAGASRRDELGEMAQAVLVFKDRMASERTLAAERETERLAGETAKRAALVKMADTIESETGVALRDISARTTAMAATATD